VSDAAFRSAQLAMHLEHELEKKPSAQ